MIRRGEYYYGRKVFGNNNKFGPIVGQSPGSAGVNQTPNNFPTVNSSSMNSGSLLKGNGMHSKQAPIKPEKSVSQPPINSKKLPTPATKEEMIVIHVCDEK
jgi:hypothetical protein